MIEIHPLSPSYPIKKLNKIAQERKRQPDDYSSSKDEKEEDKGAKNGHSGHQIDEIV